MKNRKFSVKKLTLMALLTTIALVVFVIENQINPIPIYGVKLGLANIVTVFSMFVLGPKPTFAILLARILLGNMFAGQGVALVYSLFGGLMCYAAMAAARRILTPNQIWVASVLGAIAHNYGQVLAAIVLTKTMAILAWLPVLMISGIISGLFTGVAAQILVNRLGNNFFTRF